MKKESEWEIFCEKVLNKKDIEKEERFVQKVLRVSKSDDIKEIIVE